MKSKEILLTSMFLIALSVIADRSFTAAVLLVTAQTIVNFLAERQKKQNKRFATSRPKR